MRENGRTFLSSFPNFSVILATCSNGNPIELMLRAKSRDEIDSFSYVGLVSACLFAVFWLITVALPSLSSPDKKKKKEKRFQYFAIKEYAT